MKQSSQSFLNVCFTAAVAAVTSFSIGRNSLQPHHLPVLQEHLSKFTSIEKLDMSFNPALGCNGVIMILSSLTGK